MDEYYEAMKLLELSQRVDSMRALYKQSGHYEKVFIQKEANLYYKQT